MRSVSVHCGSAELSARHPWSKVSQGQFQEWKVQSLSTRDGLTGLNLLVPLLTNQIVHDEKNAHFGKSTLKTRVFKFITFGNSPALPPTSTSMFSSPLLIVRARWCPMRPLAHFSSEVLWLQMHLVSLVLAVSEVTLDFLGSQPLGSLFRILPGLVLSSRY